MRRFNRFYTQLIGVLDEGHLGSPYSLAQVRLLFELAAGAPGAGDREPAPTTTAAELCERLALDPGYSSRMLGELQRRGLVTRRRSAADGRQRELALTPKGRAVAAELGRKSDAAVRGVLGRMPPADRSDVIDAMVRIRARFQPAPAAAPYLLRTHRPGDLGWIVHRHGVLYAEEYGWDERFESLVARIVADFVADLEPARERCWIAEREGTIAGAVFLVTKTRTVGQLRLLYVEPSARGLGIGRRLVEECTRFARQVGYRKVMLWTNAVLVSARRIYEAEGYRLVAEAPHSDFGVELVGQTWELTL